jgi:hypothetical protein
MRVLLPNATALQQIFGHCRLTSTKGVATEERVHKPMVMGYVQRDQSFRWRGFIKYLFLYADACMLRQ